jgi:hypothetical protein
LQVGATRTNSRSRPHLPDRRAGPEPAERETYANGVRKASFRDPDGNEIGFGGAPA